MIVFSLLCLIASVLAKLNLPSVGSELLTSPKGKRYVLVGTEDGTSMARTSAPQACASLGYGSRLAKLEDPSEFDYLAGAVKQTAWIESWQGKTYGGSCIAFFTGGAIAVPIGNCQSKQAVLCDVDEKMLA